MDAETRKKLESLFQQGIDEELITEEALKNLLKEERLLKAILTKSGESGASNFIGII